MALPVQFIQELTSHNHSHTDTRSFDRRGRLGRLGAIVAIVRPERADLHLCSARSPDFVSLAVVILSLGNVRLSGLVQKFVKGCVIRESASAGTR